MVDEAEGLEAPSDLGRADFPCSECERAFTSEVGLNRHFGQMHGTGKTMRAPRSSSPKRDPLREGAEGLAMGVYGLGGMALSQVDPVCGQALASCQEGAANAWYQVGKQNAAVAKFLRGSSKASVWGVLIVAHLPLIMAVQAHHIAPVIEQRAAAVQEHDPMEQVYADAAPGV